MIRRFLSTQSGTRCVTYSHCALTCVLLIRYPALKLSAARSLPSAIDPDEDVRSPLIADLLRYTICEYSNQAVPRRRRGYSGPLSWAVLDPASPTVTSTSPPVDCSRLSAPKQWRPRKLLPPHCYHPGRHPRRHHRHNYMLERDKEPPSRLSTIAKATNVYGQQGLRPRRSLKRRCKRCTHPRLARRGTQVTFPRRRRRPQPSPRLRTTRLSPLSLHCVPQGAALARCAGRVRR